MLSFCRLPIASCVLVAVLCGCQTSPGQPEPAAAPQPPSRAPISQDKAVALVLARYEQLFAPLYFRQNRDGSFHALPVADAKHFRVRDDGNAWEVARRAPAGLLLQARISKTGDWIDFLYVGYALH